METTNTANIMTTSEMETTNTTNIMTTTEMETTNTTNMMTTTKKTSMQWKSHILQQVHCMHSPNFQRSLLYAFRSQQIILTS